MIGKGESMPLGEDHSANRRVERTLIYSVLFILETNIYNIILLIFLIHHKQMAPVAQ